MLTLPIKKQWFDMILAGEKKEEYRTASFHYNSRFLKYQNEEIEICLRNGYAATSPTIIAIVIPTVGVGKVAWGGEKGKVCWVLEIVSINKCLGIVK